MYDDVRTEHRLKQSITGRWLRRLSRTDAKWTAGVCLVVFLILALATLALFQITAKDFAVDAIGSVVNLSFAPHQLPDGNELESLRKAFESGALSEYRPFPSLKLVITEKDVTGLGPDKIRSNFFRRFASQLYERGPEGLPRIVEKKRLREELATELGLLSFIDRPAHQKLGNILVVLSIISILLIACLIYLSSGFGRLANPGLALLGAGLPGLLVLRLVDRISKMPLLNETPKHDGDISGLVGGLAKSILPPAVARIYPIYSVVFAFGLGLVVLAGALKIVQANSKH